MDKYNVLDLFCGCGGMSLGFENAGYNILLGIDFWNDALYTYKQNHHNAQTLQADLSQLDPASTFPLLNGAKVDVIIGGPPCQGFSIAGKRIVDDERNKLYKAFVAFVAYYSPKVFVLENVPNILSMGDGVVRDAIISDFTALGYNVNYKVLLASDYGVPQNRKRAFFVGVKNGLFDFQMPVVDHKITTREAISDLPENSLEEGGAYPTFESSEYQTLMRANSKGVHNHNITIHNEKTKEIIALVPDGGNFKSLPVELQQTRKVNIAWTRLNSQKPSITIDCGHFHHFHYQYNRVPTVRESARLQSFPDDFIFYGSKVSQLKQVGNAVPPILAKAIAEYLKKYI